MNGLSRTKFLAAPLVAVLDLFSEILVKVDKVSQLLQNKQVNRGNAAEFFKPRRE